MKHIFFLMLLIAIKFTNAQDVIIFNNGDTLNCKINEVGEDEIYFSFKGADKKAPLYIIKSYQFNMTYPDAHAKEGSQDTTTVVQMTLAEYQNLLNRKIQDGPYTANNYQVAYTAFTIGGAAAVGALVSGLVLLTLPTPRMPDDFTNTKAINQYGKDVENYNNVYKNATASGLSFLSIAIISTVIGSRHIIEITDKRLLLQNTSNGIGLMYKF